MYSHGALLACVAAVLLPISLRADSSANNEDNWRHVAQRGTLRGAGNGQGMLHAESLEGEPEADMDARTEFVRRCTISMTVKHRHFLPTKALNAFCSEAAEDVVACKIALTGKLKKTYKEGGSMSIFCNDAWKWVARTHGMLCPLQCEKFQCMSTCAWLEEHNKQKLRKVDLEDKYDMARMQNTKVDKLKQGIAQKQQECLDHNRSAAQAQTDLDRAQTRLTEEQDEVLSKAQADVDRIESELSDLEANFTATGKIITEVQDNLTTYQRYVDKHKLKHKKMLDDAEQFTRYINKRNSSLKFVEGEIGSRIGDLQGTADQLDKWKPVRDAFADEAEKQAKKYVAAANYVERAKEALINAEKEDAPEEAMKALATLVERQTKVTAEEKVKFEEIAHKHKDITKEIEMKEDFVRKVVGEVQKLQVRQGDLEQEMTSTVRARKEALLHAKEMYNHWKLADAPGQVAAMNSKIAAETKNTQAAQRAMQFLRNQQIEKGAALERGKMSEAEAREAFAERARQLQDAEKVVAQCQGEVAKLEKQEEAENQKFLKDNKEVLDGLDKLRDDGDDLDRDVPEIVRQHGLALVQFLDMK